MFSTQTSLHQPQNAPEVSRGTCGVSGLVTEQKEGRQIGMESAASESLESFICKHQVTPMEKDLTAGVQPTMVYIGRGVIWSRTQ